MPEKDIESTEDFKHFKQWYCFLDWEAQQSFFTAQDEKAPNQASKRYKFEFALRAVESAPWQLAFGRPLWCNLSSRTNSMF